jgi:hypothetical protein
MGMPRVRFTIRRLMVAILLVGMALGGAISLRPVLDRMAIGQIAIERQSQASYRHARLVREVAEYAVRECEDGSYLMAGMTHGGIAITKSDRDREAERLKQERGEARRLSMYLLKSLRSDLEKARADEQAKLATYQKERARRLRSLGF